MKHYMKHLLLKIYNNVEKLQTVCMISSVLLILPYIILTYVRVYKGLSCISLTWHLLILAAPTLLAILFGQLSNLAQMLYKDEM
jgi:hypothetical protein